MSRNPLALTAFAAAVILISAPALAQNAGNDLLDAFSSGGDALSNEFLSRIFGCRLFPAGGDCDSRPVPVFAVAIGLFNSFCLALGMALFAWNASTGIMQTAHEGQVLGARWNSLWAPIRTLAAAAMLAPLPGFDGYNAVQTAIAWLVRGSTAAASIIWASAADLIVDHQAPITNPAVMFDQQVVGAAWQLSSCQAIIEQLLAEHGIDASLARHMQVPPAPLIDIETPEPDAVRPRAPVYGTRATQTDADRFSLCGRIRLPDPPAIVFERGLSGEWFQRHGQALGALLDNTRRLADQMIAAELSDPASAVSAATPGFLINAGNGYARSLAASLPDFASSTGIAAGESQAARERIKLVVAGSYSDTCRSRQGGDAWLDGICATSSAGQGWLGAGAWYMHMARFAGEAASLYNSRPSAYDPVAIGDAAASERRSRLDIMARVHGFFRGDSSRLRQRAEELADGVDRRWNEAVLLAAAQGGPVDGQLLRGAFADEGVSSSAWPSDAARDWLAKKTKDWFLPPATVDPMAALSEFGNAQLAWGMGLIAGGKMTEFASASLSLLPLGGIAEALGNAAVVIGGALMVSGAFLAFILPILPFLLWTAAVTGYFLLVAEAVIAANLWAVAPLRLDGEGLAGEAGRQGYYLVLALTLTPVLMVFGFLLGMAIFKVTSTLLGIGIDVALRGLVHDQSWAVWLLGMAVVAIVLVIVYAVLAERSFSLVAELPGKVLRWIGADANVASREDDRIRGTAVAGAAAVAAAAGRLNPNAAAAARRSAGGRTGAGS